MTLVILAGGMGSRFGGLKQVTPVGPNGEFIIDYSIYDAIKAGFSKVVFCIKEENYELFRSTIGKRVEGKIDVEYVFQSNDDLPIDVKIPESRVKPLGTGQAILCCKDVINEPFIVINADDFYGYDAFRVASEYIKNNTDKYKYALVGYNIVNTLTDNGSVKRGMCAVNDHTLLRLVESKVEKINGEIVCEPLDGSEKFIANPYDYVSMNMFVFYPNIFNYMEKDFINFLKTADLTKDELYISSFVFEHITSGDITCEVLDTNAVWKGITYQEDLQEFINYLNDEIERGVYPVDLYR